MRPQQEVLPKLVKEYQETGSKKAFEGILKRVDNLIISSLNKYDRYFPYLQRVDFDSKYQTALVGLGKALVSTRPEEDGGKITARILAYIKSELKQSIKRLKKMIKSWS